MSTNFKNIYIFCINEKIVEFYTDEMSKVLKWKIEGTAYSSSFVNNQETLSFRVIQKYITFYIEILHQNNEYK